MDILQNIVVILFFIVVIVSAIIIQTKIMTKQEQINYADSFDEFLHGDTFR